VAFTSGAISIFNLSKKRVDFQTEAGHAETVFDLEFCPSNKNLVGSCSYDGSVRVWNANQMKLLAINDTFRNSPLVGQEKHIIYSLSWHPSQTKIALVGSLGYLMVYEGLKQKLLMAFQHNASASYKVDWNQCNEAHILMGYQSKLAAVIDVTDMKNPATLLTYPHPETVFGVCWNPKLATQFLTACLDGKVRLFEVTQASPIKTFSHHEKKVFNVIFNPQLPNIFASGSDDLTVRVWDVNDELPIKLLKGHTHNVRAIAFNPVLSWCLISGSWDATIKLWDVRSGTCIYTIGDHNADVYGITFHQERPFVFISSSRDTSLRFWQID